MTVTTYNEILTYWCQGIDQEELSLDDQSGRSPKVVALFSATNFSSYIIELFQLHDTIQIEWNYAWITIISPSEDT